MKLKNFASLGVLGLLVSASAFAYSGAAVIVFDRDTGKWGSDRADNRWDAEAGALANAGDGNVSPADLEAGSTNIMETFVSNGWIALAKGTTGPHTGGVHDSEADAEQSALNNCGGAANSCYIVRSMSSYVDYADQDGVNTGN